MQPTPLPLPIGTTDDTFDRGRVFTILAEDRRKHMAIFGKSGVGKSTLLRNMIVWDLREGLGVTVLDPHGGLIEDLLDCIPSDRTNDVVYFSPKDRTRAVSVNILEPPAADGHETLAVSYLISIFKKIWGDSWGPRMEDILRNSAFALIEQPEPVSLVALPKLLTDPDYRKKILERVSNPVVLAYFRDEYDKWPASFRQEAIQPVLNKARAFLVNPLLRAIIGQARSSFDFRWLMDKSKILLCDLSKGALGEDVSSLLGSLIVTKILLAALSRQDIPEEERVPHLLYADEVQNFIHGADLPTIFSEARKYRLTLVIATQTINQLPRESVDVVFGNCATVMSFRVGGEDAEALKREFVMTTLPASELQDMPDYKLYLRTLMLAEDGRRSRPTGPHIIDTFPPMTTPEANSKERVIRTSLERYARPRAEVEEKINRFLSR
ncbi:MAG: type IV secretory system conjugative DNA transfer family protein [Acidobacteria bacterium]|nr:type IV secretory system conjugative DNA transfer family protein [Acidobacteriota bacterium]